MLDATVYCELKGVFHRDIKDENIILDLKTGEAKLADFGSGVQLHNLEYKEYEGKIEVRVGFILKLYGNLFFFFFSFRHAVVLSSRMVHQPAILCKTCDCLVTGYIII